jgi:penicillin-binding protein 2
VARGQVYGHQPLMVVDELTDDQKLYIGEHNADFPHVIIEEYSFRREYPLGNATTHLLGYTGPATQAQIDKGYDPEELSGKEGVERQFEDKLRGELGRRDMEIDRQGIFKNEANVVPPKRGSDLYLSIDSGTQQAAHDILVQTMNGDSGITGGAIIVNALGPENRGEILAMTSGPSYDPSKFDQPGYYSGLLRNSRMPLLNRCIGLAYPPGSPFKLVTLTTALQLGTINMNTSFYCSGYKEIGKYHQRFYCHVRSGHGMLATPDALAQSCDVFFYDVGSMLPDPPQNLHDFALQFGYGQPTDIALPGEVKGTVPDADWKWKHFAWAYNKTHNHQDQAWYDGDTLNYSIGQGFLLVTPLQDLWAASTIAWDGMHYPPRLVVASSGAQGMTPTEMDQGTATGLDPHVLDEVKSAMRHTASDPKGTCQRLNFAPGMQVCAKTGTAEASHNKNDYSWVVGFYPENNPRYGFICFFEHGGESKLAVDSAVQLLKYLKEHDPLARAKPGDKPGPGKGAAK